MLEIHFEITRLGDAGRVPMSYASWLIRQDDGADPTSRHFVQMIQLNEDIAQTDGIQFELTSAAFVSPDQNQLHRSQAEAAAGVPAL